MMLATKTLEWSGGTVKDPMTNMHKLPAIHCKSIMQKQDVDLTLQAMAIYLIKN